MARHITTSRSKTVNMSMGMLGQDWDPVLQERIWRYHGDCGNPRVMHVAGRPDRVLYELGIEPDRAHNGQISVRCRKCPECLAARSKRWAARGIAECNSSTRSWFGTLTVGPEARVQFMYKAQAACKSRVVDWSELSEDERTLEIGRQLASEITLFLKRVRKNCGGSFRYLLVQEAHKDGFPHYHLLVHEHTCVVTKRVLDGAWKLGFSQFRLISEGDVNHVFYVCKYIAKSGLARIRASEGYGQKCKLLAAQRLVPIVNALRCSSVGTNPPVKRETGAPGPPDERDEHTPPF